MNTNRYLSLAAAALAAGWMIAGGAAPLALAQNDDSSGMMGAGNESPEPLKRAQSEQPANGGQRADKGSPAGAPPDYNSRMMGSGNESPEPLKRYRSDDDMNGAYPADEDDWGWRGRMHRGEYGRMRPGIHGGWRGRGDMLYGIGPAPMGYGAGVYRCRPGAVWPAGHRLAANEVRNWLQHRLDVRGNPHVMLGSVTEKDADTIEAEIVTSAQRDLVARFQINRYTGAMRIVD